MIYREKILYFKIYFIFLYFIPMKQIILSLLSDFSLLYKHFIHWNISKILIAISSVLLWILFALPFGLLFIALVYLDPINWQDIASTYYATQTVGLSFLTAMSTHLVYVIIEALIGILAILAFWFWNSYKMVLMAKLNLDYKASTPTGFFQNYYFHFSNIWKSIGIFSWIGWIFFLLFIVMIVLFGITLFLYGWIEQAYEIATASWQAVNSLILITLGIFITGILVFIWLAYRMNYAYIIMLDEKNYPERKSALSYVKESFAITSGIKVFKFLLIAILFSVVVLIPINYIGSIIETEAYSFTELIFGIFVFLTVNGLFEMLLVSSYYSIMLGKNRENDIIIETQEIV